MTRHTRIHLAVIPSYLGIEHPGRKVKIPTDLPILFLAGPIRNAPIWHDTSIRLVLDHNEPIFMACPLRGLAADLMPFVETDKPEYELFPRQRAMEQYYMYGAAEKGCIMFYLAGEAIPKADPNKVYAHITMLELGKWIERKKLFPDTRLVIGAEETFPELSTVEYEINTELPGLEIHRSLATTVAAALKVATSGNGDTAHG